MLLRVFIGEDAKCHHRPLYKVIVEQALRPISPERRCCAARWVSAIRRGCTPTKILDCRQNLPLVIEIVDTEDKINGFLPMLDKI